MKFNKRGIVLKFLTTTVLAILLFGTAFAIVAKVFRNSDQALGSFNDFADEIKDFAGEDKIETSTFLIMDSETGIVAFKDQQKVLAYIREGSTEAHQQSVVLWNYLSYPQNNKDCTGDSCICLCKDFSELTATEFNREVDEVGGGRVTTIHNDIACPSLRCENLDGVKLQQSWSKFRYLDEEAPPESLKSSARRSLIKLSKQEGGISFSE